MTFAGLHLNLTEGLPLSTEKYKTLTNESGELWGRFGLLEQLDLRKVNIEEVGHKKFV